MPKVFMDKVKIENIQNQRKLRTKHNSAVQSQNLFTSDLKQALDQPDVLIIEDTAAKM
jgi:hypothetical protein